MAKTKRKKLTEKLDKVCRDIIKERDGWRCQHCGRAVTKRNAHCSHVMPRSKGNALRWDLLNMKLLCFHCHINWWHKNPVESAKWFRDTFPTRDGYLQCKKNDTAKYTIADLEELLEKRKEKLKELKS